MKVSAATMMFVALLPGLASTSALATPRDTASTTASTTTSTPASRRAHFHGEARPPVAGPRRIVSLSPAVTETIFVVGAGENVVGVTRYCDRPAEARQRTVVGGYTDASLEGILALTPDLVIAQPSFQQRSLLDRLRDRDMPVLVVFADTVDESADMMQAVGDVVHRHNEAAQLVDRQTRALANGTLNGPATTSRVVVVVGTDPLVVAGHNSFANTALGAAGVHSAIIASDPPWPQWSLETVAARHVDVLVAAEGEAAVAHLARLLQPLGPRRPRIVSAPRAILMRPGPAFADDLETLRAVLQVPPLPTGAP
jgi:iron complex transport system substrate-binding protein